MQSRHGARHEMQIVPLGNMPGGHAEVQVPLKFSNGDIHEVQLEGRDEQVVQFDVQTSQVSAVRLAKVPAGHNEALTHVLLVKYPTEQLRQRVCVVQVAHGETQGEHTLIFL